MDDNMMIDLLFKRDEAALEEVQRKFGKLCFKISFGILGNDEDAEECVNDTYLGVWNAIPPQRPKNLTAFICRVAKNISHKKLEYNTAAKRDSRAVISWSELDQSIPDPSLPEGADESELGGLISAFLYAQKEEARLVFVRRYYFYDDIADIANRFDFSESKVKSMLFHTRNKLKIYLIKNGVKR